MAAVCKLSSVVFNKSTFNFTFIPIRRIGKLSRWRGYYKVKLPQPVYEERKKTYRQNVMKALEEMPTLQQKLEELCPKDPLYDAKVDIGLPSKDFRKRLDAGEKLEVSKKLKLDQDIEKQALDHTLRLNLDEVHHDWQKYSGPLHLKTIADHYGVFDHLYHHAWFTPWVPLDVSYDFDEDSVTPVKMGNILDASEAAAVPNVRISGKPEDLWTLVLTNLDGHLLDTDAEYLHWFVGNIKGSDLQSGETVCDYLRPFPFRGSGYHRLVFVLYKQTGYVNYSALRKASPCLSLAERTFKTFDFYKSHQDMLTPAGLSFFQCVWDQSLTGFFHDVLNMREPVFEYHDPAPKIREQVHYPHLMPFNIYLDRYRDPKDIKKEVLLKRLSTIHPFEEEPPMPKYPCLHKPLKLGPSWLRDDLKHERLRLGKYRDLRPASVYPQEDNQGTYKYKA